MGLALSYYYGTGLEQNYALAAAAQIRKSRCGMAG